MGTGTAKRFEDLKIWQRGRELVRQIYALTKADGFKKDLGLREQIRRAAISIMLNIAEGFARGTDKEFCRYLIQAHGSAAEIQSALYVALDQQYISESDFHALYASLESLSKMLTTFAKYLDRSGSRRLTSDPRLSTLDLETRR